MKIRLVLFALLAALTSCMQFEPLTVTSVTCCDIKKALKSETDIAFEIEMENPNNFPISVKSYNLAVQINGNVLGNAQSKEPTQIPANSSLSRTITVSTSTQKLISGSLLMGLTSLLKKDPTTLEIEVVGSVVGSAKGFSQRVRIREAYPLKLHP